MGDYLTREEKDQMKDQAIAVRYKDSQDLESWFIANKIPYKKDINGNYDVYDMRISNTLKVSFGGSRKMYQYNVDKLKDRILTSKG